MGMLGPHLNWNSDLSFRKGAHDGLRMPRVEVRCPLPCPEATGVTIQVSSPCYWCPLVRNKQADTQGSGCSALCRPTQNPDYELWLKVTWCGKPRSTAPWQILSLNEGWPRRQKRKPRAAVASRPVETIDCDGQIDKTNRVLISRAPFGYPEWSFPWFSSVVRQMPGYML